jgi:hypothetical protein
VATIRKEVEIRSSPHRVWEALRDVGALQRLAEGFVVDATIMQPAASSGRSSASSFTITTVRRRSSTTTAAPASSGQPTCCLTGSRATSKR